MQMCVGYFMNWILSIVTTLILIFGFVVGLKMVFPPIYSSDTVIEIGYLVLVIVSMCFSIWVIFRTK